jgi:hypothetical protein
MTTVAELIEALQTLDGDTLVEVGKEVTDGGETYMTHAAVKVENFNVLDFTDKDWKNTTYYGLKVLMLEAV